MASKSQELRLYILCQRHEVKTVKTWLEQQDGLFKEEKIERNSTTEQKDGDQEDAQTLTVMRIPTTITTSSNDISPSEVLSSHLDTTTLPPHIQTPLMATLLPLPQSQSDTTTPPPSKNILTPALLTFLTDPSITPILSTTSTSIPTLLSHAPKRWSLYPPLALLPNGTFTTAPWPTLLSSASPTALSTLSTSILTTLSTHIPTPLTHLAINRGIPPSSSSSSDNILRSPSHLHLLHGAFGPSIPAHRWTLPPTAAAAIGPADFEDAFWVAVRQNGIVQIWAPRWTMFSRGNVKEKARVLGFEAASAFQTAGDDGQEEEVQLAIDMYAGIGYFTLSYLRLGYTVLAWELNPFSVEGLRRGASANGFSAAVVRGADLADPAAQVERVFGEARTHAPAVLVFEESNEGALARFEALQRRKGWRGRVRHVNLGFLPSSVGSWRVAARLVCSNAEGGWVHAHENVGEEEVARRRGEVEEVFVGFVDGREVKVRHVEFVKTFAPGVWHVVFDVWIGPVGIVPAMGAGEGGEGEEVTRE